MIIARECKCRHSETLLMMAEIRDKELLGSFQWVQRWIKVYSKMSWFPYIRKKLVEPMVRHAMLTHISKMDKWELDTNQSYFHTYNCKFINAEQRSYKEFISIEFDDPFWRNIGRRIVRL